MPKLTTEQLEDNYNKLLALTAVTMEHDIKVKYHSMLHDLKGDVEETTFETYLGGLRAPAAKGNHHAFEGGWCYHLLEMWDVYLKVKPTVENSPWVTDERVLQAIINHDLHKAYKTFIVKETDPWRVEYGNHSTDRLMGNDVKSIWILGEAGINPDPEQMNALINAEGGYAKIKTDWVTVLSKLCYLLDEMSGNVYGRIEKGTYLDLRKSEI